MRVESAAVSCTPQVTERTLRVAAWVLVAAAITCLAAGIALGTSDLVAPAVLLALVLFTGAIAASAIVRGGQQVGVLRSGAPDALEVGDAVVIASSARSLRSNDVLDGWCEERGATHQVVAQLVSGEIFAAQVEDAKTAEAILDALGIALHQRALTLRIGTSKSAWSRVAAALFCAAGGVMTVPAMLLFIGPLAEVISGDHRGEWPLLAFTTGFLAVSLTMFLVPGRMLGVRTVRIGRDGVSVKRALSPAWFVSYRGMTVARKRRLVTLTSGKTSHHLPTTAVPEATALAARIEEARAAFHERAAVRAELLSRQGRPLDAWRASLARLAQGEDYRTGLGPEELLAIVEDAASFPDERVAAATALAALPHDDRRSKRVRVAVEATVDPKLRVALERALDGVIDEAALEAAEARHAR